MFYQNSAQQILYEIEAQIKVQIIQFNFVMSQIISIFVGSGAIRLASSLHELYALQYNIQDFSGFLPLIQTNKNNQQQRSQQMFRHQSISQKIIPRTILVDSDDTEIDQILTGKLKDLFDLSNLITSKCSSNKCFSKAYNKNQQLFQKDIAHKIINQAQKCQNLQGFQIFCMIGGGTSSGLCSKIIQFLKKQFASKQIVSYVIHSQIPANESFSFQAYNSVLGYQQINNQSTVCLSFDNFQLRMVYQKNFKDKQFSYRQINKLLCLHLSNVSYQMRFKCQRGNLSSLSCLKQSLIQQNSMLKYVISINSPILSYQGNYALQTMQTNCKLNYFSLHSNYGEYHVCMSYLDIFRGQNPNKFIGQAIVAVCKILKTDFYDFLPGPRKFSLLARNSIDFNSTQLNCSRSILINSQIVLQSFNYFTQKFDVQLKKMEGLNNYLSQGMEVEDFTSAIQSMATIYDDYQYISHYQFCSDQTPNYGQYYEQG